jgi:cadmium resistance protein CadD (predicted permease)
MQLLPHVGLAIVTFVVTNIDDLLLLSFYFSSRKYRNGSIIAGQYAGIVALIFISLTGVLAGEILADHWVSLLGLLPLILGVRDIFKKKEDPEQINLQGTDSKFAFLQIALITIANGGDNVGVYAPLFGNIDRLLVVFYAFIFMVLTGCWCYLGSLIAKHPHVKTIFARYGHVILPVFLILLGLFILKEFFVWVVDLRF